MSKRELFTKLNKLAADYNFLASQSAEAAKRLPNSREFYLGFQKANTEAKEMLDSLVEDLEAQVKRRNV